MSLEKLVIDKSFVSSLAIVKSDLSLIISVS